MNLIMAGNVKFEQSQKFHLAVESLNKLLLLQ